MRAFDIASHKWNVNSEALHDHTHRQNVNLHFCWPESWGIFMLDISSFKIEIEGIIQNNRLVNSLHPVRNCTLEN